MPNSLRSATNTVIYYHSLAQYTEMYSDKECHDVGMMHRCQPKLGNERRRPKAPSTVEILTCEVRVLQ